MMVWEPAMRRQQAGDGVSFFREVLDGNEGIFVSAYGKVMRSDSLPIRALRDNSDDD
jgi:hypothetical protein